MALVLLYQNPATATVSASHTTVGANLSGEAFHKTPAGTVTYFATTTGNVATATALQTARTINGTSFNGTANITVVANAGVLLVGSTVAGLPAVPAEGMLYYATDLAPPTYGAIAVGGGSVKRQVFYDGTNWVT